VFDGFIIILYNDYVNPAYSVVKNTVGIATHYGVDGRGIIPR